VWGSGIAIFIDIALSLLFAMFVQKGDLEIETITYLASIVVFISTLTGGLLAEKMSQNGAATVVVITGVAGLIIRLCAAMLIFDGVSMQSIGGVVIPVGVAVLGACLLRKREKRTNNRRKKRRHH